MSIGCTQSVDLVVTGNSTGYYEWDVLTKHDYSIEINLTDCDGLVIDLTDATATVGIKESWDSADYDIIKELTVVALEGKIIVELDNYETELLERCYNDVTNFLFEINVLKDSGFIAVISGKINAIRGLELTGG